MKEVITIKYKTNNKNLRLFGKQFVENNIDKCKLIIDNEEQELKEFIFIKVHKPKKPKKKEESKPGITKVKKNISKSDFILSNKKTKRFEEDDELEVNLIGAENIIDMSYMFSKCSSLISLDFSDWKTSNIENMRYMFNHCDCTSFPNEISNIDTSKVTNMSFIFNKCDSLLLLPDISNWNTSNVRYMNNMFEECESLKKLNITKFETKNVKYMNSMFKNCSKLQILDVSNFNTQNVLDMNRMFQNNE
jgi:surface protein